MTTQRRYYEDSYKTRFSARVVESRSLAGKPALVLDETYFYPTGGGQPHDTGTMTTRSGKQVQVIDVQTHAEDKSILHVLSDSLEGETVECAVDWKRRFDFMQQHTGQHILSRAFIHTANALTVGFHLGSDQTTIDLDKPDLDINAVYAAEALANEILFEDKQVSTRLISPDDADGIRMRRVPEALATEGLRIVEIADYDTTACGGTHVARTGEIGMIKVLTTERHKGGTRISFVCGGRALRAMQLRTTLLNTLTADLSCALADLPDIISKLRETNAAAEKTLRTLQERLSEYKAASLIATAEPRGTVRLILHVEENGDPSELRLLAARIVREPGVIALLATVGDRVQVLCARSPDLNAEMNAVLQAVLAALGGKGGGQPALAQGGAPAAEAQQVIQALRTAAEQLW